MMKPAFLAAAAIAISAAAAAAGPIDSACMKSGRSQNASLCGCIQSVADMTLSGSDQRLAAKFFLDPGKAQEVRSSSSRRHQDFWQRYTAFGTTAEAMCAQ